jgi:hypothetical protein
MKIKHAVSRLTFRQRGLRERLAPSKARSFFTVCLALAAWPVPAATVTWLGDIPEFDANWTTDANWYGGASPSPGDHLIFGASKQNNNNDFPANTPFVSITLTNDGWNLTGNAITLTNAGIAIAWNQTDPPDNPNLLDMAVTFTSAAIIANTAPGRSKSVV